MGDPKWRHDKTITKQNGVMLERQQVQNGGEKTALLFLSPTPFRRRPAGEEGTL